jgi:hypothetical protein
MKKQFIALGVLLAGALVLLAVALSRRWVIVPPIENYDFERDERRRQLAEVLVSAVQAYQQEFSGHYPWNSFSLQDAALPRQPGARFISDGYDLSWLDELTAQGKLTSAQAEAIKAAADFHVYKDSGNETGAFVCFQPQSHARREQTAAACRAGTAPRIQQTKICATADGSLTAKGQANLFCVPD